MKERPIIFSGPMVRAILDGRKTQTRRVIKPQPEFIDPIGYWRWPLPKSIAATVPRQAAVTASREWHEYLPPGCCPYGVAGDRLWVRETWQYYDRNPDGCRHEWFEGPNVTPVGNEILLTYWRKRLVYRSDGEPDPVNPISWRAPIHMPHWASRILLEITDVRVQRVQEISEAEAMAEGITHSTLNDPRVEFQWLWNSIHGSGAWERNEWVWAITFRVIEARRAA